MISEALRIRILSFAADTRRAIPPLPDGDWYYAVQLKIEVPATNGKRIACVLVASLEELTHSRGDILDLLESKAKHEIDWHAKAEGTDARWGGERVDARALSKRGKTFPL